MKNKSAYMQRHRERLMNVYMCVLVYTHIDSQKNQTKPPYGEVIIAIADSQFHCRHHRRLPSAEFASATTSSFICKQLRFEYYFILTLLSKGNW